MKLKNNGNFSIEDGINNQKLEAKDLGVKPEGKILAGYNEDEETPAERRLREKAKDQEKEEEEDAYENEEDDDDDDRH